MYWLNAPFWSKEHFVESNDYKILSFWQFFPVKLFLFNIFSCQSVLLTKHLMKYLVFFRESTLSLLWQTLCFSSKCPTSFVKHSRSNKFFIFTWMAGSKRSGPVYCSKQTLNGQVFNFSLKRNKKKFFIFHPFKQWTNWHCIN